MREISGFINNAKLAPRQFWTKIEKAIFIKVKWTLICGMTSKERDLLQPAASIQWDTSAPLWTSRSATHVYVLLSCNEYSP